LAGGGTKREGMEDGSDGGGRRESQPKIDKGPEKAKSLAPADRRVIVGGHNIIFLNDIP